MTHLSRRRWAVAAALLALAASLIGCGHQTQHGGAPAVKVGLLVSLSGTYASVGTDMRDGFQLYLATHGNKLGGHPVQVITADELKGFVDAFAQAGGQLANPDGKATFTPFPQTDNFTPYFAKIKQSGAKAVYCFYAGRAAIDFVKGYKQSEIADLPLYAAGFL